MGYAVQEQIGNWLKEKLKKLNVKTNLDIGDHQYNTDTKRRKFDIVIGDQFKIDVKTSEALREGWQEYSAIIITKPEYSDLTKYPLNLKIIGFYYKKDIKNNPVKKINDVYFKSQAELRNINELIKFLNKFYKINGDKNEKEN